MRIESVDFFYLKEDSIDLRVDGSQDALLVRVTSEDGTEGWGECEASPLPSVAAFYAPLSHGACQPVGSSVLGERVTGVEDIARIGRNVSLRSPDLLQAPHTFSGVEIALWDLLGKAKEIPVWQLLGYEHSYPKRPYASALFGTDASETFEIARALTARGFSAVKFGWGGFGIDWQQDRDQLHAARDGVGSDSLLMVDAGQVWGEDAETASCWLPLLKEVDVVWLEEPFTPFAVSAYRKLRTRSGRVALSGGEASHSEPMARLLIDHGDIDYIQIDTGRIGGIFPAFNIARDPRRRPVQYVNHTFTSPLALAAGLQPFAGIEEFNLCEFPVQSSRLAQTIGKSIGKEIASPAAVMAPDAPGLGIEVDIVRLRDWVVDFSIEIDQIAIYSTPDV